MNGWMDGINGITGILHSGEEDHSSNKSTKLHIYKR